MMVPVVCMDMLIGAAASKRSINVRKLVVVVEQAKRKYTKSSWLCVVIDFLVKKFLRFLKREKGIASSKLKPYNS